jgi:hypothetical protein
MEESYRKGLANHPGPESCMASREAAIEALTGEHAGRTRGMPNSEIPCGSIRMVSQWDGIPRQLLSFNMGLWPHQKFRGICCICARNPLPVPAVA